LARSTPARAYNTRAGGQPPRGAPACHLTRGDPIPFSETDPRDRSRAQFMTSMTTLEELKSIYELPLTTLIMRAQEVHHRHQDPAGVQLCTLKSIKTGKCSEDCKYCPQSAHTDT